MLWGSRLHSPESCIWFIFLIVIFVIVEHCNPKMTRILIVIKIHGIESKQNIHNIRSRLRGLKSFAFKQISVFTLYLPSLRQDPDINVN